MLLILAGNVSADITNQQQADQFISKSKALGFDTEQLILVKQK
jgi:lipocalin